MEKVILNNLQLDYLAWAHPSLACVFHGTVPCDRLPRVVPQEGPTAYIVNTDPHDKPGMHWLALWTHGNVCEIMDSYAIPLDSYGTAEPLKDWMGRHYKYQVQNERSLQSIFSQSCGAYALMFLIDRAEGRSMNEFLNRFTPRDFVWNDHHVGLMLRRLIVKEKDWCKVCEKACHQDTQGSLSGVHHLLH